MAEKRKLEFADLDQAYAEVENLLGSGYTSLGKWNLAQCCGHLNLWLSFPLDGYPASGRFVRSVLWLIKQTMGRRQLQSILASGFKHGTPTMPATVLGPDFTTDAEAAAQLGQTISRFNGHIGPIHASPLFGPLDKATATRLQIRHFEHHLGFLYPR